MRLFLVIVLAWIVAPATAAEVGRVEFNGRTIVLHDDQTWAYLDRSASGGSSDCTTINSNVYPMSFCLDDGHWKRTKLGGDYEMGFQVAREELYLGVISERTYLDAKTLRSAILDNAKEGAGLKGIDVLEDGDRTIGGHEWGYLKIRFHLGETPFIFHFHYTSHRDKGSVQYIMFSAEPIDKRTAQYREMALAGLRVH